MYEEMLKNSPTIQGIVKRQKQELEMLENLIFELVELNKRLAESGQN